MTTLNPARQYRQAGTRGASPVGLIVQLYDAMLSSLYHAIRAQEAGDIEKRTANLNHALAVLGELQSALDFERGGEVARYLRDFYNLTRTKICEGSAQSSKQLLVQVANQLRSLRDAWQQVETSLNSSLQSSSAIERTTAVNGSVGWNA